MPYFLRLSNVKEPIEFLSLGELAKLCGKSKEAIKKLTERGLIPDANFRSPKVLIHTGLKKGQYIAGYRLYSKSFLVPILVDYIKKGISRGKQITIQQRSELMDIFQSERDYFKNTHK